MEAVPQLHLLFVIFELTAWTGQNAAVEVSGLFCVTFVLSLASATFGIVKFIKAGPASIVRNDKWLEGFGTWTFILLYLNVACTLITKGSVICIVVGGIDASKSSSLNYLLIFIAFLPQCFYVSSIVVLS